MEQMRSEFEAWMERDHLFHGEDFKWEEERNCYAQYGIHLAWKAWQASRESIEIDAPAEPFYPMPINNSPTDHYHYGRESVISKVRAAGLSVKEK